MKPTAESRFSLYAEALTDYYNKRPDMPPLYLVREDGLKDALPLEMFFNSFENFSTLEKKALDRVSGKTLDVGAGAGRHSLALMDRGIIVTALDTEVSLVKIMIDRGLKHVVLADIRDYVPVNKYDTILLLMHGLGIGGTLDGLNRLLACLAGMLEPGGRILADSLDVSQTDEKTHLKYHEKLERNGRYKGEIRMFIEYEERKSELIEWLHVDFETLSGTAKKSGLRCILVERAETGEYLAEMKHDD